MALARNRILLMFFTSALTPRGSPGRCTDTLASTLSWPSVGRKVEVEAEDTQKRLVFVGERSVSDRQWEEALSVPDMLP